MKMWVSSRSFYFVMNKVVGLVPLCLTLAIVAQGQSQSERSVTAISPVPPVVVPAKRVTVSQALRFGEQAEPRPDTLAKRSDLPVVTARQPVQFDHDLLRWELGFDRGDGYHKLRIRVTNLADTPQSFELLYAPIASRDGSAETNWRIVAEQMIQPGQVFTDWQSVLIENNITRLVFLMRRRDAPAKDRAVSAYSRNPEADYPIPAAVSLKADLTGDVPKVIASPSNGASALKSPLILPATSQFTSTLQQNPDNHFRQQPFKLERTVDMPVLPDDISFEIEGLRWEVQNFNQCLPPTSPLRGTRILTTRCTLKILVTVTNLTNDKQTVNLMSSIPEQGDGTVRDHWETVVNFQDIYPGRSASKERTLTEIRLTDTTQRTIPLRWLFRAYRDPSGEEQNQRRRSLEEAQQQSRRSSDPMMQAYRSFYTDPPAAYWKVFISVPPNQRNGQSKQSQRMSMELPRKEAVKADKPSESQAEAKVLRKEAIPIDKNEASKNEPVERIEYPANMTLAPRLIHQITAEYTPDALAHREQGTVILVITIREDGTVDSSSIRIVNGLRFGLNEQAIKAVKQTKFEPARCNNQPCAVPTQVRFNFTLNSEEADSQPTTSKTNAPLSQPVLNKPVLKEKDNVQSMKPTRRRWP